MTFYHIIIPATWNIHIDLKLTLVHTTKTKDLAPQRRKNLEAHRSNSRGPTLPNHSNCCRSSSVCISQYPRLRPKPRRLGYIYYHRDPDQIIAREGGSPESNWESRRRRLRWEPPMVRHRLIPGGTVQMTSRRKEKVGRFLASFQVQDSFSILSVIHYTYTPHVSGRFGWTGRRSWTHP